MNLVMNLAPGARSIPRPARYHCITDASSVSVTCFKTDIKERLTKGAPKIQNDARSFLNRMHVSERFRFLFHVLPGGRIDHAHHLSMAKAALVETLAFEEAVQKATELTSADDTLIMVTADHSHTLTIGGGYPTRENSMLGTTM